MKPEQQTYDRIVKGVAEKLNLPVSVVDRTYRAYWKFVRVSLSSLPLKRDMTEEEFNQLRTSINIPSLGKFSCDYERYTRMRKRIEYTKKIREDEHSNQKD